MWEPLFFWPWWSYLKWRKLKFASGSLAEYLDVSFSEKLPSTSTVDDVEGTLANFIPAGRSISHILKFDANQNVWADYYKNEEDFLARVEKDAVEFKPPGEKIFSYKRSLTSTKGKSKAFDAGEHLDEENDDVVVFEVYHVCNTQLISPMLFLMSLSRPTGIRLVFENTIVECNYSSSCTLKEAHISRKTKKDGNSSSCKRILKSFLLQ